MGQDRATLFREVFTADVDKWLQGVFNKNSNDTKKSSLEEVDQYDKSSVEESKKVPLITFTGFNEKGTLPILSDFKESESESDYSNISDTPRINNSNVLHDRSPFYAAKNEGAGDQKCRVNEGK